MDRAYDPELVKIAHNVAKEMDIEKEVKSGVYTCVGGPNYETVAELRMLKLFGVDAVGMSTVSRDKIKTAGWLSYLLALYPQNRFMKS